MSDTNAAGRIAIYFAFVLFQLIVLLLRENRLHRLQSQATASGGGDLRLSPLNNYTLIRSVVVCGLVSALLFSGSAALQESSSTNALLLAHIGSFFAGISGLALSFLLGCLLLLKNRSLKTKKLSAYIDYLPPLESLDALMSRLIAVGFPFLSLGLLLGFFMAHQSWSSGWQSDPKVLFALLSWLWYALLLFFRQVFGWRGKRLAWLNIFGFAVVLLTLIGVHSQHA